MRAQVRGSFFTAPARRRRRSRADRAHSVGWWHCLARRATWWWPLPAWCPPRPAPGGRGHGPSRPSPDSAGQTWKACWCFAPRGCRSHRSSRTAARYSSPGALWLSWARIRTCVGLHRLAASRGVPLVCNQKARRTSIDRASQCRPLAAQSARSTCRSGRSTRLATPRQTSR